MACALNFDLEPKEMSECEVEEKLPEPELPPIVPNLDGDSSESESQVEEKLPEPQLPLNMSPGGIKLREWLNKSLRIQMFDRRVLIGAFLCTDREANVILGSCTEYLPAEDGKEEEAVEEPRMLGLVMVPGKHIQSVAIDESGGTVYEGAEMSEPLEKEANPDDIT